MVADGIPLRSPGGADVQEVPESAEGLMWVQSQRFEATAVIPAGSGSVEVVRLDLEDVPANNFIAIVMNAVAMQVGDGSGSGQQAAMTTYIAGKDLNGDLQLVDDEGVMFVTPSIGFGAGTADNIAVDGDDWVLEWEQLDGNGNQVLHYVVQVYAAQAPFDMQPRVGP